MLNDNCTLLIMSCDKYHTAWDPYFQLLNKYWPEHPERIVLSTETMKYSFPGMNITTVNSIKGWTWSQRLKDCLTKISTDYIIFSLEDFFLQARVKHDRIETCYEYMLKHAEVAVCRLKNSSNPDQVLGAEVIPDFYLAGPDVDFRLETQFALWNRTVLLSYIDESESPWEFEAKGTKRIVDTPYQFLWYQNPYGDRFISQLIVPYVVGTDLGYGINWGKWLWKNKKLFRDNGITADFSELGIIGPTQIRYRQFFSKAIYQKDCRLPYVVFRLFYRVFHKIGRVLRKNSS